MDFDSFMNKEKGKQVIIAKQIAVEKVQKQQERLRRRAEWAEVDAQKDKEKQENRHLSSLEFRRQQYYKDKEAENELNARIRHILKKRPLPIELGQLYPDSYIKNGKNAKNGKKKGKAQKKKEEKEALSTTASPWNSETPCTDQEQSNSQPATFGTALFSHDITEQKYINPYGSNWEVAMEKLEATALPSNFGEPCLDDFKDGKARIWSWNINGFNSVQDKAKIRQFVEKCNPDIFTLQELKTHTDAIVKKRFYRDIPDGYEQYWNTSKIRRGYAGVGLFTKVKPIRVMRDIGILKHDQEGRILTAEFEKFYLVAAYIPNSGDNYKRIEYRINEWDWDFLCYLKTLERKKPVLLGGDLNVAHMNLDIYMAEYMGPRVKTPGTTKPERSNFSSFLDNGFVDIYRTFYPRIIKYSYWSNYEGCFENNYGQRIDYFVCSQNFMCNIVDASIHKELEGSDHCPILVKIDFSGDNPGDEDKCQDMSQKSYGIGSEEELQFTYEYSGNYIPEVVPEKLKPKLLEQVDENQQKEGDGYTDSDEEKPPEKKMFAFEGEDDPEKQRKIAEFQPKTSKKKKKKR